MGTTPCTTPNSEFACPLHSRTSASEPNGSVADGWRMLFAGAVTIAGFYLEKRLSQLSKPTATGQP